MDVGLGVRRNGILLGLAAALGAYAATQALWALSTPHSAWINLIFQLFPEPVVYATAWLIALYPALGLGVRAGEFAFAFAIVGALATGVASWMEGAPVAQLFVAPLLLFALHAFLSVAAFAMGERKAPPFAVFCVLAIVHGAHNGGLIALARQAAPLTVLVVEGVLAALYAAAAYALLRQMPAAAKIG